MLDEWFEGLPGRGVPPADGLAASYRFDLAGDGGGTFHVVVGDGSIRAGAGPPPGAGPPDVTVRASAADWQALVAGELDPQLAFLTGRLAVTGDMMRAQRVRGALGF